MYLLHSKLDVLGVMHKFFVMVKNQFSQLVKIVQTYNAFDYFKSECTNFFSSLGAIHQSSCPYIPQQNGVTERKHRHILEITISLHFQASLPLKFWGDCVFTAVRLCLHCSIYYIIINRARSSLLQNKTPLNAFFTNQILTVISVLLMSLLCQYTTQRPQIWAKN